MSKPKETEIAFPADGIFKNAALVSDSDDPAGKQADLYEQIGDAYRKMGNIYYQIGTKLRKLHTVDFSSDFPDAVPRQEAEEQDSLAREISELKKNNTELKNSNAKLAGKLTAAEQAANKARQESEAEKKRLQEERNVDIQKMTALEKRAVSLAEEREMLLSYMSPNFQRHFEFFRSFREALMEHPDWNKEAAMINLNNAAHYEGFFHQCMDIKRLSVLYPQFGNHISSYPQDEAYLNMIDKLLDVYIEIYNEQNPALKYQRQDTRENERFNPNRHMRVGPHSSASSIRRCLLRGIQDSTGSVLPQCLSYVVLR